MKMLVLFIDINGVGIVNIKMDTVELCYDLHSHFNSYIKSKEIIISDDNISGVILIETRARMLEKSNDGNVKIFIANGLDKKVDRIIEISDLLRKNELYGRWADIDYYWSLKRRYSIEKFEEIEQELKALTDELNRLIAS